MNELQSDAKAWKRYYAINSEWVQSWLDFVQAPDKKNAKPPGPVANEQLVEKMCTPKYKPPTERT